MSVVPGRVVHYVSHGTPVREDGTQAFKSVCRSAEITEVGEWVSGPHSGPHRQVGLLVKNPTGLLFHPISDGPCPYQYPEEPETRAIFLKPGTWHWPQECRS